MLHPHVQVGTSTIAGQGLIVTAFIPSGAVLWWADGTETRYTFEAYQKLPDDVRLLCYQEYDHFVLLHDNAQYTNHSCDPTMVWRDDSTNIASRDLVPGDELTYDYATTETDPRHRGTWPCHCGAARCRHIITPQDCLSAVFQAQYPILPSWTRLFIEQHNADHPRLTLPAGDSGPE